MSTAGPCLVLFWGCLFQHWSDHLMRVRSALASWFLQPAEQQRLYSSPEGEKLLEDNTKLADAGVENDQELALTYKLDGECCPGQATCRFLVQDRVLMARRYACSCFTACSSTSATRLVVKALLLQATGRKSMWLALTSWRWHLECSVHWLTKRNWRGMSQISGAW